MQKASEDRLAVVALAIKRQHRRPESLIEVLHAAQQVYGFLGRDVLGYVARELQIPPSRVYGVATFYKFFTLKPAGKHTCVVCMGTACYVKGAPTLLSTAEESTGLHAGATTPDGELSLFTARCLGACGTAPIVIYDGNVAGHQTRESVAQHLSKWTASGHPTTS